jgi:hypothetical protein
LITWRSSSVCSVSRSQIPDLTYQDNDVLIEIAYPALSVICPLVHVRLLEDRRIERACLRHRGVKPTQLKPEQHTVPVGCRVRIAKVWVPVRIPCMKLQDNLPIADYLFVLGATVPALTIQELLVPPAAALDVPHSNEGLRFHVLSPSP